MIRRTFQHIPGVGPWREKDLWARGILSWDLFPDAGVPAISKKADVIARARIAEAQNALERRDLKSIGKLFPAREHWRLYGEFADDAMFFDIECDGQGEGASPTVVSLFSEKHGLEVFILGRNMDELPEAMAKHPLWVSFNGSVYDVPMLQQYFGTGFPEPELHVDLRFFGRKVRMTGGLKDIEDEAGIGRPPHLKGVNGMDAVLLWRAYQRTGDVAILRFLVEYNLYDAIQLRSLIDLGWNRAIDDLNFADEQRRKVFERGDVLYDLNKLLLALSPTSIDVQTLARLRHPDSEYSQL